MLHTSFLLNVGISINLSVNAVKSIQTSTVYRMIP